MPMDRSPGLTDEIPEDPLGQATPGLAIAGGIGGDGGEPAVMSIFLESIDGVVAGTASEATWERKMPSVIHGV